MTMGPEQQADPAVGVMIVLLAGRRVKVVGAWRPVGRQRRFNHLPIQPRQSRTVAAANSRWCGIPLIVAEFREGVSILDDDPTGLHVDDALPEPFAKLPVHTFAR
jgi:hypothetical protein